MKPYLPHAELNLREAAALLEISRMQLVMLMDDGIVPYHIIGKRRHVLAVDVMRFMAMRDQSGDKGPSGQGQRGA